MLPFMTIVLPLPGVVNLSNPFKARQWLKLLTPDTRYGLRFHPDLDISRHHLGFSFESNSLGFRGPAARTGKAMLLGTSFAMGLSVDNGLNWYDGFLNPDEWLNGSMPVGPQNQQAVVEDFYRGSGDVLLYIYHPNIWRTAQSYVRAAENGLDIFSYLRWKTSLLDTIQMYPKWIAKEITKSFIGQSIFCRWNGQGYHLNATYNYLETRSGSAFADQCIENLRSIFSKFSKVIVIRSPIKEDSVPENLRTAQLDFLNENYEFYWEKFRTSFDDHVYCYGLDHKAFGPDHFLPFDTHWRVKGNAQFREMIRHILEQEEVGHLLLRELTCE